MQPMPLALGREPTPRPETMEVDERIERLMRVQAVCGRRKPELERRFNAVVAKARMDALAGGPAVREAALAALGVLSLELCDD